MIWYDYMNSVTTITTSNDLIRLYELYNDYYDFQWFDTTIITSFLSTIWIPVIRYDLSWFKRVSWLFSGRFWHQRSCLNLVYCFISKPETKNIQGRHKWINYAETVVLSWPNLTPVSLEIDLMAGWMLKPPPNSARWHNPQTGAQSTPQKSILPPIGQYSGKDRRSKQTRGRLSPIFTR